jgi:hypothetical protein
MRRVSAPKLRLWVISALLVALVVRALIPAGFMPATDRPFSFQVCPDGFPAALLTDTFSAASHGDGAGASLEPGAAAHAGHHHSDDGTAVPDSAGRDDVLAHTGHHHHADGLLALAHQHDAPGHNHSSVSSEHCAFAAAAGVFALAFLATFSAPAATLSAPEVPYVVPAFGSRRFRIPQPRGPPALS